MPLPVIIFASISAANVGNVNYTFQVHDKIPRRYDTNIVPSAMAVEKLGGMTAWNSGEGQVCGKPVLVPPHEKGVARATENGYVCYDGYKLLPKFVYYLDNFAAVSGFPEVIANDFKMGRPEAATEAACLQAGLDDPLAKGVQISMDGACTIMRAAAFHRDHKKHLYDCAAPAPGSTFCVMWNAHLEVDIPPFPGIKASVSQETDHLGAPALIATGAVALLVLAKLLKRSKSVILV